MGCAMRWTRVRSIDAMQNMNERHVIQVSDLTVAFTTPERSVVAVRDLSFHVSRGETLAIVGESGSGKSVTSLSLMRLVEFGNGHIEQGRILLRRRVGGVARKSVVEGKRGTVRV